MTRMILLALLLPLAARAQIALYRVDTGAQIVNGGSLDMGQVAAGDTVSVRIRVRNTGTATANITYFFTDNTDFTITNGPLVPFPIAPGSAQDANLSFSESALGIHRATLQVNSDANNISVSVAATVVPAPVLTVSPPCTISNSPLSIDFGLVQAGQQGVCNFSLQNPGTADMTVLVTGASFHAPTAPPTVAAGATTAFAINFTASAAGVYSGALAIGPRTYVLTGTAFVMPLPTPILNVGPGPFQSSQQQSLTMSLPTAVTYFASGNVNLAFVPDTTVVTNDATVMFLPTGTIAGTRSLPFSISPGSTQILINGQTSAMFQTGTSAGHIIFTLSGIPTAGDATETLTIPAAPISIETAAATQRTGDLDIEVTGFDNTYSAGIMTFTFFDTAGKALSTGAIRADFTQDFRTFFTNSQAGSMFQVRVSFPVTGDTSGIGSVDVQLSNSAGIESQHLIFQ